jgi:hypothetical protein
MTTKPALTGAIAAMIVALTLGAASGFILWLGNEPQRRVS